MFPPTEMLLPFNSALVCVLFSAWGEGGGDSLKHNP